MLDSYAYLGYIETSPPADMLCVIWPALDMCSAAILQTGVERRACRGAIEEVRGWEITSKVGTTGIII